MPRHKKIFNYEITPESVLKYLESVRNLKAEFRKELQESPLILFDVQDSGPGDRYYYVYKFLKHFCVQIAEYQADEGEAFPAATSYTNVVWRLDFHTVPGIRVYEFETEDEDFDYRIKTQLTESTWGPVLEKTCIDYYYNRKSRVWHGHGFSVPSLGIQNPAPVEKRTGKTFDVENNDAKVFDHLFEYWREARVIYEGFEPVGIVEQTIIEEEPLTVSEELIVQYISQYPDANLGQLLSMFRDQGFEYDYEQVYVWYEQNRPEPAQQGNILENIIPTSELQYAGTEPSPAEINTALGLLNKIRDGTRFLTSDDYRQITINKKLKQMVQTYLIRNNQTWIDPIDFPYMENMHMIFWGGHSFMIPDNFTVHERITRKIDQYGLIALRPIGIRNIFGFLSGNRGIIIPMRYLVSYGKWWSHRKPDWSKAVYAGFVRIYTMKGEPKRTRNGPKHEYLEYYISDEFQNYVESVKTGASIVGAFVTTAKMAGFMGPDREYMTDYGIELQYVS